MADVEKKRCVIVSAGKTGSKELLQSNIREDDFVIAADAGYQKCLHANIQPDLIIGDFDSAEKPKIDIPIIELSPEKDESDTESALHEAEKRGFTSVLLLGATGGRIDHSVANLILIANAKQRGINIRMKDEKHCIFAVKDDMLFLKKDVYRYFSVFAVGGPCQVSITGAAYPLKKYTLSPYSSMGVSNEITENFAMICAHEGTALVIQSENIE